MWQRNSGTTSRTRTSSLLLGEPAAYIMEAQLDSQPLQWNYIGCGWWLHMPARRRSWLEQGCADQFRAGLLMLRGSVCAHRKQPLAKVTNKKLDERSPCSPSKRAGFRIVQFCDDSTKEVPSFAKIVASRTARAATSTESCRGARACQHVTFPAFSLLFIVHSKKTEPWGVFDFFQMFSRYSNFLFSSVLKMLLSFQHINFKYILPWESNFPFFARKSVVLPFHPQASVRCRCASYIYHSHVRRAKASRWWSLHCNCTGAMQRGRQQKPRNSWTFFFVKADVLFWKRSSFVYLEESVDRVPSFVPSSLRHRCRSWRLMFLKSVSRLPDYPTLKNDSHEAWKCSATRKKYFERPHTAVFRRQRLGTTPSTQIFKQDDRFGAKRRRLLLWSVRERLISSATVCVRINRLKLWLSRLSFFGMDYSFKHRVKHFHGI